MTYKQHKVVCEFLFQIFFFRERFFYDHFIFFNPISNIFYNVSLKLNVANHFFSALRLETDGELITETQNLL